MSKHHIQRFPRLPDGMTLKDAPNIFVNNKITKTGAYMIRISQGDYPRGFSKLTKEQKKLARLVASGMTIKAACKKLVIKPESFYRWRSIHPMFRTYLNKKIMATLEDVEGRLERHVVRATQVVDEALDHDDQYFAASVAKDVLKGRGRWKNSSTSQITNQIDGRINLEGKALVSDGGASKEMMQALVDGFIKLAGGVPFQPKIIDAEVEDGTPALPSAEGHEGETSP